MAEDVERGGASTSISGASSSVGELQSAFQVGLVVLRFSRGAFMTMLRITLFGLALAILTACHPLARDPGADAKVRQVYTDLRRGDMQALRSRFTPEMLSHTTAAQLAQAHQFIPPGEPRSRKALASSTFMANGATTVLAVDEYDYGDRVTRVDVRLYRAGSGPWQVQGFHISLATAKELAIHEFSLLGKSPLHYLILVIVIGSPLLMLAALLKVLRTEGLKRKWLWILLALLGVTKIQMNWTTGALAYHFATVQLIGFGVTRGLSRFDPWVLTLTLPIGALLILGGFWANPRRAWILKTSDGKPALSAPQHNE